MAKKAIVKSASKKKSPAYGPNVIVLLLQVIEESEEVTNSNSHSGVMALFHGSWEIFTDSDDENVEYEIRHLSFNHEIFVWESDLKVGYRYHRHEKSLQHLTAKELDRANRLFKRSLVFTEF